MCIRDRLRIVHVVAEHRRALLLGRRGAEPFLKALSVENIVAQHHGHGVVSDKLLADDEGLRQAVGAWLHRIA